MEGWNMNVTSVTIELLHSHLTYHIQYIHEWGNNDCDLCDYKAYTKCILKRHLAQKHNGVKSFKCDQCDYATGTGSNSFLCPKIKDSPEGSSDPEFRSSILCGVIKISWWLISRSTQNGLKMTSFIFRVGLCRIRLSPRLISKVKWIPLWTTFNKFIIKRNVWFTIK